jgi:hypothetical protein
MQVNEKREYIGNLANLEHFDGMTITIPTLAAYLNESGFRTDAGGEYQGGRGTYRLLRSTHDWLNQQGLRDDATAVAQVFVTPDGRHAWN